MHTSVKYVTYELCIGNTFELQRVSEQTFRSQLLKINVKKRSLVGTIFLPNL